MEYIGGETLDSVGLLQPVESYLEADTSEVPAIELKDSLYVDLTDDDKQSVDELAEAMAVSVVNGFMAHDHRNLEDAAVWFMAKDFNMFENLPPENIQQASTAYVKALDAKDRLEWYHLPGEKRTEYSEQEDIDYSLEEIFGMAPGEATDLGVGEVSSQDLCGKVEELSKDNDGWDHIRQLFHKRDRALEVPVEGLYSVPETVFWRNHKTDRNYLTACSRARLAELSAATGIKDLAMHAIGEETEKPSDGRKGPTTIPLIYGGGVELHDIKDGRILPMIPNEVAPYYRSALITRFMDDFDLEDMTYFGLLQRE